MRSFLIKMSRRYSCSGDYLANEVRAHKAKVKAIREGHEAAMQAMRDKIEEMKAAMQAMEDNMLAVESQYVLQISAAMQAFETEVAARRVYHEAPNDVFELIVLQLPDVGKDKCGCWVGNGGLSALRLVCK